MLNSVNLLGRVGKDATHKTFGKDAAVVEFSLATTDSYKDKDGKWQEKTQWHNIKQFGKSEGIQKLAERVTKGLMCLVTGKIEYRQWDDKDGNKRYMTEIVADRIQVIGAEKKSAKQEERQPTNEILDDLPFTVLILIGTALLNLI